MLQLIKAAQVRTVAGGSGITGNRGTLYQTEDETPSRLFYWDGEKHVATSAVSAAWNNRLMSNVAQTRYNGSANPGYGLGSGQTFNVRHGVPFPFTHVRISAEFIDPGVSGITKAAVAVTDYSVPYPAASSAWVPATFNGGSASVSTTTGGSIANPKIVKGDWIPLQSVAPVSGSLYGACGRCYYDGSVAYTYFGFNGYNYGGATGAIGDGLTYQSLNQVLDGIASPSAFTQSSWGLGTFTLDFITSGDVLSIAAAGDSTSVGIDTLSGALAAVGAAARILTTSVRPVIPMCCAYTGLTMPAYCARAKILLPAHLPSIAVIQVGTVNAAITNQAGADSAFALAMDMVQFCRGLGIFPVLTTGHSHGVGSNAADVYRQGLIARLKAAGATSTVFAVCDTNAATADPANPWALLPAYDAAYNGGTASSPNLHPNDAGQNAAGAALAATLRSIGV